MAKTIILIHGRAPKPSKLTLQRLWVDALRHGIKRDHPETLSQFDRTRLEFVYYADLSRQFLADHKDFAGYDARADAESRRQSLKDLKAFSREDFLDVDLYNRLPGKTAFKEGLADALGGILSAFRLSEMVIAGIAPDMQEYWNFESAYGSAVRWPAIGPLIRAMDRGDRIMVLAHSLGSLVAWDTFWKFAYTGEYRPRYSRKKIDVFVSVGSPLGDETVKRHVKGAQAMGLRRYPPNLKRWVNVAAEDDYVAHDQMVADDFKPMLETGMIDSIEDHRIYNLAVRNGKSNPHHAVGYLVHPIVSDLVASWV